MTLISRELQWLPVACRIHYKVLLLTFKCTKKIANEYLTNLQKEIISFSGEKDNSFGSIWGWERWGGGGRLSSSHAPMFLWKELPHSVRTVSSFFADFNPFFQKNNFTQKHFKP